MNDALLEQLVQQSIKQFILSWYSSIAEPNKQQQPPFIKHINQTIQNNIIPKLTKAVSQINLINLLTYHIPTTLNNHLTRINAINQLLENNNNNNNFILTQLHLHPAIKQQQQQHHHPLSVSPTYLRLLIEAILQSLLPDSDYNSETERYIIREIILQIILLPLLEKLSQPCHIQTIILNQLLSPTHTMPIEDKPDNLEENHNTGILRATLDQLICHLNSLLRVLRHIPAFLGTIIHLISLPAPIPIPDHNPRQFLPLLDLIYSLLGNPPHLEQLFWLLKIASRIFNPLLSKIVAHLIYDHLVSPAAVTNHLLQLTTLLSSLDAKEGEREGGDNGWLEAEQEEGIVRLSKVLAERLSTPVFRLICPAASDHGHQDATLLKRRFIHHRLLATIQNPILNQALLLHLIDLLAISFFPALLLQSDSSPTLPTPL